MNIFHIRKILNKISNEKNINHRFFLLLQNNLQKL